MKPRQLSQEERRTRITFNQPYASAVATLRRDALSRPDYDPANLFSFGAMMARGLIEMLRAVEAEFGEKGQQVATQALVKLGLKMGKEALDGVVFPEDMSPVEIASTLATWLNEVLYASVEAPSIDGAEEFSFHIRWCPLQDIYAPLDCRIQRYLVEGMFQAAQGILGDFQAAFDYGIPSGNPTCHFHLWRSQPGEGSVWDDYTRLINLKALEKAREGR